MPTRRAITFAKRRQLWQSGSSQRSNQLSRPILAAPDRWRVVEEPGIRRYVFSRFPYVLYYRWDAAQQFVTVFAVMHCSREPGYWKPRIA